MAMQCAYHPDREPVGACVSCGKLICSDCKAVLGGKIYCTPCADNIFVKKEDIEKKITPSQNLPGSNLLSEDITKVKTVESDKEIASSFPEELKGWNWGAFFLTWIWGIGNKVWISFLTWIPVPLVGLVMMFILGAKGNEWAWQHKKWDSIEHFQKTQNLWKRWGIGLFIAGCVIAILYTIAIAFILLNNLGTIKFPW